MQIEKWLKLLHKKYIAAANFIFRKKDYQTEYLNVGAVKQLREELVNYFTEAVQTGLEHRDNHIPDAMRKKMDDDLFIFAGCKTESELREVGALLRNADGTLKSRAAFIKEVQSLYTGHIGAYLQAEHSFAVASSQSAAKWHNYAADGDAFHLQYRTAQDDRVRDSHAKLANVTLPITDPFWDKYFPPNGWRCFTPETLILTAQGWKRIDSIQQGEMVIGGSGVARKVLFVHKNDYNDKLIRIKVGNDTVETTPNHRFLTLRGWIKAKNLLYTDVLVQQPLWISHFLPTGFRRNTHFGSDFGTASGSSYFKFFGNFAHHFAIGFINTLANVCTLFCLTAVCFSKHLRRQFSAVIGIKPLRFYGFAARSWLKAKISHKPYNGAKIHTPAQTDFTIGKHLNEIEPMEGFTSGAPLKIIDSFQRFFTWSLFHTNFRLIDDIAEIPYKGTVFNLMVDKDETYTTKIAIVHNCRCTVVQVKKNKYPLSDSAQAIADGNSATSTEKLQIFRFNPGKQGTVFPPHHPYYKALDAKQKAGLIETGGLTSAERIEAQRTVYAADRNAQFETLQTFENGGRIDRHLLASKGKSDYNDVLSVAEHFAQQGKHVEILPEIHVSETEARDKVMPGAKKGKNPDLRIDGVLWEVKTPETPYTEDSIRNIIAKAADQSEYVIVNLLENISVHQRGIIINNLMYSSRSKVKDKLKTIVFKYKDEYYTHIK